MIDRILFIAVLATLLAACGGPHDSNAVGDADSDTVRAVSEAELEAIWKATEPIVEAELAKDDAQSAARFPCTLYSKESASELLGSNLESPVYASEYKNRDGLEFKADACSWSSWGTGPDLYVWASRPSQFPGGVVPCSTLSSDSPTETILDGIAEWNWQESFGWARLQVCRSDGLFFVEIHDVSVGEQAARDLAIGIVEQMTKVSSAP